MSKTIDFINDNLIQLGMDINVLQSDKDILIKKIVVCDNGINSKQAQIDKFNKELNAIKDIGKIDEVTSAIV